MFILNKFLCKSEENIPQEEEKSDNIKAKLPGYYRKDIKVKQGERVKIYLEFTTPLKTMYHFATHLDYRVPA